MSTWQPPGCGRYKMNVAFCLSPGNSQAGLGVLVQDHNGAVAATMCTQILWEGDVLQAHARSLLIALQFAFDTGLRLLEVDVRCQALLGLLNHGSPCYAPMGILVEDICSWCCFFHVLSFFFL